MTVKTPDGSTVTTTVLNDTQPGGLQTRTYTVPFALTSREADHRLVWDFFAKQNTGDIE